MFQTVVEDAVNMVRQQELLEGLPDDFPKLVREEFHELIESIQGQIFGDFPLASGTIGLLVELIAEMISRQRSEGTDSGVVIAGFGEAQCFPSLVELRISGVLLGHVLFHQGRNLSVDDDTTGLIVPFAQGEMVHTFMEGVDPDFGDVIKSSVKGLFKGVSETIFQEVKDQDAELGSQVEASVSSALDLLLKNLLDKWKSIRRTSHSQPIMNVVASLPKAELAAMAESLVNMTKFKRQVSEQQETVGGPIDVAVITKGDGFVWIKRKHYFESDLNARFVARHYGRWVDA